MSSTLADSTKISRLGAPSCKQSDQEPSAREQREPHSIVTPLNTAVSRAHHSSFVPKGSRKHSSAYSRGIRKSQVSTAGMSKNR